MGRWATARSQIAAEVCMRSVLPKLPELVWEMREKTPNMDDPEKRSASSCDRLYSRASRQPMPEAHIPRG
jgi:hypothetical protein